MSHLSKLGDRISIPINPDEDGFTGRECHQSDCEGYFKIECGTGLEGRDLPCHCPYCGHAAEHDQFWTKEQVKYIESAVTREVTEAVHRDLKEMEFNLEPRGSFGIGFSVTPKLEPLLPIHHYREKQLETEVACTNCTLHYSIYGVFGFCPDCGQHNSLQILGKNIEVVAKMMDLAESMERDVSRMLVENGLVSCVSVFDGFGRELCRVHARNATNRTIVGRTNFQDLERAKGRLREAYGIDLSSTLTTGEWQSLVRAFQKRHLIAHKMGVVDQAYLAKAADTEAIVGRRIHIKPDEVRDLLQLVRKVAQGMSIDLDALGEPDS